MLRDRDADGNAATGGLGAAGSGMEQRVYYLTDGNFNVTALADPNGAVLERYAYDAYGKARIYDPNWAARQSSSYANAILFCGYFRDAETGMYHVRHRYYHPRLGRWINRDPVGYADGMDLYEYSSASPIVNRDVMGLSTCGEWYPTGDYQWAKAEEWVVPKGFSGTAYDGMPCIVKWMLKAEYERQCISCPVFRAPNIMNS